jgi:hypothetical protein
MSQSAPNAGRIGRACGRVDRAARRIGRAAGRLALLLLLLAMALVLAKAAWFLALRTRAASALAGEDRGDLLARRDYLLARIETGFAQQSWTPSDQLFRGEWTFGTLAMTATALTNLSFLFPDTRAFAVARLPALIERTMSASVRAFDRDQWDEDPLDSLDGPNGHIGYLGHLNLMLGGYRLIGGDDRYEGLHARLSEALARRMDAAPAAHIQTYPGEIYSSDNATVAASIAVRDLVAGSDHRRSLRRFLDFSARLVDPRTGLTVFSLDRSGRPSQGSRGCGAGWSAFYLPFVEQEFAAAQWSRLREAMVEWPLPGFAGVREHPRGVEGRGDVDSGPLLLGISPSATGFAIASARRHGDRALLDGLLATAELAGFTVQSGGKRRYLSAPLVGDAIVLAMRTATRWDRRFLDEQDASGRGGEGQSR